MDCKAAREFYHGELMNHHETVQARWNGVEGAVRDGCLKTCELGPTVSSLSHRPDAPPQVNITTCRVQCELAALCRLNNPAKNPTLHRALAASGYPDVHVTHYDEGSEPSTKEPTVDPANPHEIKADEEPAPTETVIAGVH